FSETACESFTWNGTTYTTSGDYTYAHEDANGCTQVDTLHLTVNNPTNMAFSETACESFTWNGTTYTVSGDYTFAHEDANGCTQVDTLHLTINQPVTTEITIETADSCYIWNGLTYCASGDYVQTFTAANNCDSVVTLHLTTGVGIQNHDLNVSMIVYPNPTTNILNVQCTINDEQWIPDEIHLFDAYGKLVFHYANLYETPQQTVQIDMSQFAYGLYFVKAVKGGKVVAVRKVVKS
ncbi:MAG: T9SS type A sorting domain-containing protein, partial [Bacteroidales bacterium]|nr:T9SS type A sorting domain-containing protein [Bacteroidales bacterium]